MNYLTEDKTNCWATPQSFFNSLVEEFDIGDFDPCPINPTIDGLLIPWVSDKTVFVNPPFSKQLKEDFLYHGLEQVENQSCPSVLYLIPCSTSTALFHQMILKHASLIFFLDKRIAFEGFDAAGNWINPRTGVNQKAIGEIVEKKSREGGIPKMMAQSGKKDLMLVLFEKDRGGDSPRFGIYHVSK